MNVLVTGSAGFLGRNVVQLLKTLADKRNCTRPNLSIGEIYEYDRDSRLELLDEYCAKTDFVINLAGVNRPKNLTEFKKGNLEFASLLLNTLKKHYNTCPVMLSSSLQATLAGRFGESEYGRSKLAGENLFFNYAKETGATVYVYRYPNLVGRGVKPNYNSAVGTWCYNYSHDLPIQVNDLSVELELLFVDDLIQELLDAMEGHPHRCEYPVPHQIIDGIEYDGLTPRPIDNGRYCYCPLTYKATLGRIIELLDSFKIQPQTLMVPDLTPCSFEKKLYSMYISYLPKEKMSISFNMNIDSRGSFTEILHTQSAGQVSVNVCAPGHIRRGEHWHSTKLEWFIVVSGHGLIRERNIVTGEIVEFEVFGDKIKAIIMVPGWTHSIENLSETENLVTIMWANENFTPEYPETYYEPVLEEEK